MKSYLLDLYIHVFCRMTDRPTDQINYKLAAQLLREKKFHQKFLPSKTYIQMGGNFEIHSSFALIKRSIYFLLIGRVIVEWGRQL